MRKVGHREQAFAKMKADLGTIGARTPEALDQPLAEAIALVRPADARGSFKHAGYPLPVQV